MAGIAQGRHTRAVPCPSCGQQFFPQSLRFHLKSCLVKQQHIELPCPFCDTPLKRSELEKHKMNCKKRTAGPRKSLSMASLTSPNGRTLCAICQRPFSSDRIARHQGICRQQFEKSERRKSQQSTPPQQKVVTRQQMAAEIGKGAVAGSWRQKRDAQKEAFERTKRQQLSQLQKSIDRTPKHEILGIDLGDEDEPDQSPGVGRSESSRCSTDDTAVIFTSLRSNSGVRESTSTDSLRADDVFAKGKWACSSSSSGGFQDDVEQHHIISERSDRSHSDSDESASDDSLDRSSCTDVGSIHNDGSERLMTSPPRRSPPSASSSAVVSSRMDSARSDALSSLREIGRTTDDTANPSACDIIPSGTALLAMKISSSSGVASWRESSW